jgi:hypothetical protein
MTNKSTSCLRVLNLSLRKKKTAWMAIAFRSNAGESAQP